jgi:L-asparaginase II
VPGSEVFDGPVLVTMERSGVVESAHRAAVVVLDADGRELASAGTVDVPIFPRSANKPLQATGMLRAGLSVTDEQLAMVTASHSGEPGHIKRILQLLAAGGFAEEDLRCPPSLPLGEGAQRELLASGGSERRAAMNCSGKHAGMLCTSAVVGWPAHAYLDPENPAQQQIRDTVAELTGHPLSEPAVDGCGAPLWPVPLRGLATAFQRLVHAETGTPERTVADVMRRHPWLIGGTDRDVTRLMAGVPGLLAKDGAEGVLVAAVPGVGAVALKIADGSQRARTPLLVAALRRFELAGPALDELAETVVLGGGRPLGAIRSRWSET